MYFRSHPRDVTVHVFALSEETIGAATRVLAVTRLVVIRMAAIEPVPINFRLTSLWRVTDRRAGTAGAAESEPAVHSYALVVDRLELAAERHTDVAAERAHIVTHD
jgi:hypothetical protein